ncbi:dTMP kinase [Actinomarinicola tropica]|uniref:Thymidylate kinase n=1 Tax=Actinomarinicola tropica TaxID=2789776 RepID=A0A5Q2RNI9_9ACTN|nr:dTMP kinase [Actinomarinicola tropica]QGG96512.1 dTMP kinase [Actinomarinicola tropica]
MTGRFIAFEGGEASGKSTQARLLAERIGAVLTREPGGTHLGEVARDLLLDPAHPHLVDRAEALLFAAARAQHVAEVIRPALDGGRHVVCDRFAASSFAYQAYGRGLDLDAVRSLSAFAVDGTWPDLNVLLVVDADVAEARLAERDKLEQAGDAFHERVAAGFDALAAADPDRWIVVDGSGSIEEVARRVWGAVEPRLDGRA